MRMKYAIVGGDMRSVLTAEGLAADGHTVHCFANEKADIRGCVKCSCLPACIYGADWVILPIPAEKGSFLNAPLSDEVREAEDIIACLVPGQKLVGGDISEKLISLSETLGIYIFDLLKDESFAVFNAELTAEAAVGLLIHECDRAIYESRALVIGFGRIGRALSSRLVLLGGKAAVAARNENVLEEIESAGMHPLHIPELESCIGDFDFIINTVPARILSSSALCSVGDGSVLMELASAPGGFDANLARNIGLKTISALGLPGHFSPRSSAQYIKQYVYRHNAGRE